MNWATRRFECFPIDVVNKMGVRDDGKEGLTHWNWVNLGRAVVKAKMPPAISVFYLDLLWRANEYLDHPISLLDVAKEFGMDRSNLRHRYIQNLKDAGIIEVMNPEAFKASVVRFSRFLDTIRRSEAHAWHRHKVKRGLFE